MSLSLSISQFVNLASFSVISLIDESTGKVFYKMKNTSIWLCLRYFLHFDTKKSFKKKWRAGTLAQLANYGCQFMSHPPHFASCLCPGKAVEDNTSPFDSIFTWETRTKSLVPGIRAAQLRPLWSFREWTSRQKIFLCLPFSITLPTKSKKHC